MSALSGFSDNKFKTRDDCITATYALLRPLGVYTSTAGARVRLSPSTGTHYDDVAAQLEGYARPLWGVAALLASDSEAAKGSLEAVLDPWIRGIRAGTDPSRSGGLDGEWWGFVGEMDQRMVEVEIIGYALLTAPDAFLPAVPKDPAAPLPEEIEGLRVRNNIIAYLRSMNGKQMPNTNWRFFRVMSNLALVESCGIPYDELKPAMDADLDELDSYYMGNGWSSDGNWNEDGRQADYYSGSFAIQFSQLLYIKHAADIDPVRCQEFTNRAKTFASQFWRYFSEDGSAIPFGRSLTYRFTFAAFWSALAVADIPLPDGLQLGHVKGLLLRHLRWWAKQPDIFNSDGTLNIGYCFPNMYMSEDYNSPQSPYWCMKTFVAIALPESHPFWTCTELSLPKEDTTQINVELLHEPSQILVHSKSHHFLLSSGQYCGWPLKATEAKYSKFAYSSAFGFSVPTGSLIQQVAPDNTLAISELSEENQWRVRWKSSDVLSGPATLRRENGTTQSVPKLQCSWSPSKSMRLNVQTTLISPTTRWPHWQVRIHRVTRTHASDNVDNAIKLVEGGFAIHGRNAIDGSNVQVVSTKDFRNLDLQTGGAIVDESSALVVSDAGASGIYQLSPTNATGVVLKPDANTNLITQRSLIPTIQQKHTFTKESNELLIVVAVFAMSTKLGALSIEEITQSWHDKPVVCFDAKTEKGDFIEI